jgi:competence protein ComEC
VLRVEAGGYTALVTGDIEAEAERDLLASGAVPRVDVMVAPHHGSRTSSTRAFVLASRPRWVVYAVGYRNRWNFPHPRVAERWEQAGARALWTSQGGAITFELIPGQFLLPPTQWRLEAWRPWRDP